MSARMITLVYLLLSEIVALIAVSQPTGWLPKETWISPYINDDNIGYWGVLLTIGYVAFRYKFNIGKWLILIVATAIGVGLYALDLWYVLTHYPWFLRKPPSVVGFLIYVPLVLYPLYIVAVLKWVKWPKRKINAQAI
jgi:hypothetical protein